MIRKPELPDFNFPECFNTSYDYLYYLVIQGLNNKYQGNAEKVILQSELELEVIKKSGYVDYFLIIADIISWAKEQDIPVGLGRGSAPASLVVYALGITSIDPVKYGLIFERFFNLEDSIIPDIDIDISSHGRKHIVNYVIDKYGKNHVGQILFNGVAKDGRKYTCISPAGFVISKNNLETYGPVYNDPKTDIPVIKYDRHEIKKYELVNFDYLGLKTLDEIRSNEISIRKCGGQWADFSINDIPLDDLTTYNLFSEGNTDGVFQFESEFMRHVLRQVEPDCFEHLTIIYALCHPDLMATLFEYIERRHGRKPIEYPHSCFKDILEETYGLIVFQEQFIKIIQRISGCTLGESCVLWRCMKMDGNIKDLAKEKEHFIINAVICGINESDAAYIFDHLASISRYMFLKSHAVCYTLLAYQTAYLKTIS